MKMLFKIIVLITFFTTIISVQNAYSHCDTKSGPVIISAKEALKTGNINLVLIWVKPEAEEIIKKAVSEGETTYNWYGHYRFYKNQVCNLQCRRR